MRVRRAQVIRLARVIAGTDGDGFALFAAGVLVKAPEGGDHYPPFQDQAGWILADKHLMGRTVLDIDDRKIEAVNDVLLQIIDGQWRA